MQAIIRRVRRSWEKNWPEIHCALSNGLPQFVGAAHPKELLPGVPVFTYHEVRSEVFDCDLAFLTRNGYRGLIADELIGYLQGQQTVPDRSVVLSFDDGAVNLYNVVFPLLKRYQFPVVAFVSTGFHKMAPPPSDGGHRHHLVRSCYWEELLEMHESGLVDVQGHSHSHRFVPRWPEPLPLCGARNDVASCQSPDNALSFEHDVMRMQQMLSEKLGKDCDHFAFPGFFGTDEAIAIGTKLGLRSFWWGGIPRRPVNYPGDPVSHVVRLSGEFVRRLPGEGRVPFMEIARNRLSTLLWRRACERGDTSETPRRATS